MLQIKNEITPVQARNKFTIRDEDQGSRLAPKPKHTAKNYTIVIGDYSSYRSSLHYATSSVFDDIFQNIFTPSKPVWLVVSDNKVNDSNQDDSQEMEIEAKLVNFDRIHLLAKKYAMKELPREDEARLLILQEKIRNMFPRVDKEDYNKLDEIAEKVKLMDKEDEEIRLKLTKLA